MLVHKQWGEILRTGNFLFKYASMLGLSKKYDSEIRLPKHFILDCFENQLELDDDRDYNGVISERMNAYDPEHFEQYADDIKNKTMNIALNCFLQSPKYWEHCEDYVIEMLKFREDILGEIRDKYKQSLNRKTIGISIRRGDWVGHGVFAQIPIEFYIYNLYRFFPDWEDCNIIFFSDDPTWIRETFSGENVYYVGMNNFLDDNYHNNPMEQVLYGSLCDNFIISNSTFSWWLAYLAVNCKRSGKVVHSNMWMTEDGSNIFKSNPEDYYHKNWIISDFVNYKGDTTELPTYKIWKGRQ